MPVELCPEGSEVPIGAATSDISLGGCYVEMMFTLAKGTKLEISMKIDGTVLALGTVVTGDPRVGNGIKFNRMLPEDLEELRCCLEAPHGRHQNPRAKLSAYSPPPYFRRRRHCQ